MRCGPQAAPQAVPFRLSHSLVILWIWRVPPPPMDSRENQRISNLHVLQFGCGKSKSICAKGKTSWYLVHISMGGCRLKQKQVYRNTYPCFPCQVWKWQRWSTVEKLDPDQMKRQRTMSKPKGNPFLAATTSKNITWLVFQSVIPIFQCCRGQSGPPSYGGLSWMATQ